MATKNDAENAALLAEQEAFLSSGSRPAAKIFRTTSILPKPSETAHDVEEKSPPIWYQQMKGVRFRLDELEEDDKPYVKSNRHIDDAHAAGFVESSLMGDIVERKTSNSIPVFQTKGSRPSSKGFPPPRKYPRPNLRSKTSQPVPETTAVAEAYQPEGKSLMQEIDEENRNRLAKMSEEEILELQKSLRQSLPVALQEILLQKSRSDITPSVEVSDSVAPKRESETITSSSNVPTASKPNISSRVDDLSFDAHLRSFFSKDETAVDQPEWTLPVHPAEEAFYAAPDMTSPLPSSMRFDFNGKYIPPSTSHCLPTHLGLHHHSIDPGAAGYTLAELGILARSVQPSQKCIALKVIGFVLADVASGKYTWDVTEGLWDEIDQEKIIEILLQVAKGGRESGGNRSVQRYAEDAVQRWIDAGGPKAWDERLRKKGYETVEEGDTRV